ncbi:MAG: L-seryl-tRNA(Sec) selenium transferase [Planctomycetes bacterium]|nr:L-seryl-tRNA(Sec) selenium transferase [Planctomycetota bacterium]
MREIGATNKVHYRDYENAITEKTAGIMKIHPSNFKIIGFTSEVPVIELSKLGKEKNLPIIDDLGAGAYADISRFGHEPEPLVSDSVRDGADIVCSSGDKLVGGMQAGVIVGKKIWMDRLRKHPLYRALRCDKITLAGLYASLQLFLDPDTLHKKNPTWFMMSMTDEQTMEIAKFFAKSIKNTVNELEISLRRGFSELGSGSLPGAQIPTGLVTIKSEKFTAEELARKLRLNEPPVFTRIEDEQVIIDVRTLQPGDHEIILLALKKIVHNNYNKTTKKHNIVSEN